MLSQRSIISSSLFIKHVYSVWQYDIVNIFAQTRREKGKKTHKKLLTATSKKLSEINSITGLQMSSYTKYGHKKALKKLLGRISKDLLLTDIFSLEGKAQKKPEILFRKSF